MANKKPFYRKIRGTLYETVSDSGNSVLRYRGHDNKEHYVASSEDPNSGGGGGVTVDDSITEESTNPVTSAAIYTALSGKQGNVLVVEVSGATPTQELSPNTFYKFTGDVTSLTVTLASGSSGNANIYAFSFTAGADAPTISLPQGVEIADEPDIATGDYVEFSIMDNKAIAKVWSTN